MIRRRDLLGLAVAVPAAAAVPNLSSLKSRSSSKIEIVYKTPHSKPNGLDLTSEGMWILDQGPESWVSLVNPEDGKLVREFKTDVKAGSGLVVDEDNVLWITSTHNSLIVSCSPKDGKTIAKYITPGAGRIYSMKGDPPARRTTLKPAYPAPESSQPRASRRAADAQPLGPGQVALETQEGAGGTGAHGIVSNGGLLYYANPPARHIFIIDKKTWVVQGAWPVPGNRCHDLMWVDSKKEALWCADSNLNAFFKHDAKTGQIVEKIQLPDDSPVIHGAKLYNGYMYFCDDVGWMCRFKMSA